MPRSVPIMVHPLNVSIATSPDYSCSCFPLKNFPMMSAPINKLICKEGYHISVKLVFFSFSCHPWSRSDLGYVSTDKRHGHVCLGWSRTSKLHLQVLSVLERKTLQALLIMRICSADLTLLKSEGTIFSLPCGNIFQDIGPLRVGDKKHTDSHKICFRSSKISNDHLHKHFKTTFQRNIWQYILSSSN